MNNSGLSKRALLVACAVISLGLFGMVSQSFAATDITGKYTCSGADADGKNSYSGPMEVRKNGDTYSFEWLDDSGFAYNIGTGIYDTKINNGVSIAYWDPVHQKSVGIMYYQVLDDGSLHGHWASIGSKTLSTENCSKTK